MPGLVQLCKEHMQTIVHSEQRGLIIAKSRHCFVELLRFSLLDIIGKEGLVTSLALTLKLHNNQCGIDFKLD